MALCDQQLYNTKSNLEMHLKKGTPTIRPNASFKRVFFSILSQFIMHVNVFYKLSLSK